MTDEQQDLKRQLRAWDPVARVGEPDAVAVAEMREALSQAARRRPRFAPVFAVLAMTAATVVVLFFLPGVVTNIPSTTEPATAASADPVSMQYTASNGVRIHWSIYPETTTDHQRQRNEERP
jgi:hypothetical protein